MKGHSVSPYPKIEVGPNRLYCLDGLDLYWSYSAVVYVVIWWWGIWSFIKFI